MPTLVLYCLLHAGGIVFLAGSVVRAVRYARQLEEMIALGQLWQCYTIYLDKPYQGQAMLNAMRDLLKTLPDDVLDNSTELRTRRHWETWIAKAGGAKDK